MAPMLVSGETEFPFRKDISLLACGDDTEPFWQLAPNLAYFPVPMEEIGVESAKILPRTSGGS